MTDNLRTTDAIFYGKGGLDRDGVEQHVAAALQGADDGELYLE